MLFCDEISEQERNEVWDNDLLATILKLYIKCLVGLLCQNSL